MNQSTQDFDARLRRIERARGRSGRSVVYKVDERGRVRRRGARRLSLWRLIRASLFLGVALFLFKLMAFSTLGEAEYDHRTSELAGGSDWEQLLARAMQPDPLTLMLAPYLHPLLKDL